jgi:hypothetical protein
MAKYEVTLADGTKDTVEAANIGQDGCFVYFQDGEVDSENQDVIAMFPVQDVKAVKKVVESVPEPEVVPAKKPRKKRNLTDEARKAISDAQKARWAARKAAAVQSV